jgi:hypothetical protein
MRRIAFGARVAALLVLAFALVAGCATKGHDGDDATSAGSAYVADSSLWVQVTSPAHGAALRIGETVTVHVEAGADRPLATIEVFVVANLMDLPLLMDSRIVPVTGGSAYGSIDFEMPMPTNLNFKTVRFLATATDVDGRRTSSFNSVRIIGWD